MFRLGTDSKSCATIIAIAEYENGGNHDSQRKLHELCALITRHLVEGKAMPVSMLLAWA